MTTQLSYELTKGVDGEWTATLTGVSTSRSSVLNLLGESWSSMTVEGAIKKSMSTDAVSGAKRYGNLVFNCTYMPEPAPAVNMVEVPIVVGEEPAPKAASAPAKAATEEKKADEKPKTTRRRRTTSKKTTKDA